MFYSTLREIYLADRIHIATFRNSRPTLSALGMTYRDFFCYRGLKKIKRPRLRTAPAHGPGPGPPVGGPFFRPVTTLRRTPALSLRTHKIYTSFKIKAVDTVASDRSDPP
jgi:hypothetical protein